MEVAAASSARGKTARYRVRDAQGARKFGRSNQFPEVTGSILPSRARNGLPQRHEAETVRFEQRNAALRQRNVDCVTLLAVLEQCARSHLMLREIHRVLKLPALVIALPNVASFSNRVRILLVACP